eukprot:gene8102-biopygen67
MKRGIRPPPPFKGKDHGPNAFVAGATKGVHQTPGHLSFVPASRPLKEWSKWQAEGRRWHNRQTVASQRERLGEGLAAGSASDLAQMVVLQFCGLVRANVGDLGGKLRKWGECGNEQNTAGTATEKMRGMINKLQAQALPVAKAIERATRQRTLHPSVPTS